MKRDTIFFQLFTRSPEILFALMPVPPANTEGYTFESIAVKETTFTIDGVFIPPNPSGDIVFAEVQFQRDKKLDERILSESGIYIYRNIETFHDWRIVIIYASRKIEQISSKMPPELFESGRITRIYLDELGPIDQLSAGPALMVLTTIEGDNAVAQAKRMLERSMESAERGAIIDMVVTIMAYKFKELNQDEVNKMLGIELKDVRAFRETFEDGERNIVLRQLSKKFGDLSVLDRERVEALDADRLQELADALLNFAAPSDLVGWLDAQ
jgi:predicted transposase/invertase (TIGR01784 family)